MAYEATTIMQLLILLVWTAMHTPKWINPLFHKVIPTREILTSLIMAANIHVVPGLFDVIQAATPPTIEWFKSLPDATIRAWGVYVLVLEKDGCFTKIYIGSSTDAKYGLKNRMQNYTNGTSIPWYVIQALQDGYEIVSKTCLLCCPIPSASNVPRFRIIIVALEAVMMFIFWAGYSQTEAYGFDEIVPWSYKAVEWHGLCSHTPFIEGVTGDFDLSDEQLEEIAAMVKQKNKEYQVEYGKNMRANADATYRQKQKEANAKRADVQKAQYAAVKASQEF